MQEKRTLTMDEMALEERRRYHREYRARNKEKVNKQNANYWKRKAEKRLQTEINNEEA